MLITKVAAAGIFTCTASAKLAGWPLLNKHGLVPQQQQQHGQMSVAESNLAQRPLSFQFGDSEYIDKAPYRAGQFTLTLQDGSVCATYGESHWTGTIDVTDSRRLFFSAIESRNDPENDPVVFWMNGGPGGSSMEGVGFSSVAPGAKPPGTDIDGAEDFQSFLNVFFSKVFPEKANLPIIIAAESYGGHYGPVYLNHILESRRYGSSSAFNGNITGLILVDAVLDFTSTFIGIYQLLCEDERGKDIITEQECAGMRVSLPECERLGRMCDISKNGIECSGMFFYCQENVWGPYLEKIVTGEKSPYNIHRSCPEFPEDCTVPGSGNMTAYLNQPSIKKALKVSPSFEFRPLNWELNRRYTGAYSMAQPTTHFASAVLDAYRTPKIGKNNEYLADIKVLVLNGNDDAVVNTYGNMWQYDHLLWSGQAEYRAFSWKPIPADEVAVTGTWKATRDGRLVFMAVDGAGHMVPGDVREGSYKIVNKWLKGDWHF